MEKYGTATLALLVTAAADSLAGGVQIVAVESSCNGSRCSFEVTLKHQDEGWEHYANRWQVVDGEGRVLGDRVLFHPHVNEQPFTRSLAGVEVAPGISTVYIVARDSVHGETKPYPVTLNRR